jgi:hypothetical protein
MPIIDAGRSVTQEQPHKPPIDRMRFKQAGGWLAEQLERLIKPDPPLQPPVEIAQRVNGLIPAVDQSFVYERFAGFREQHSLLPRSMLFQQGER